MRQLVINELLKRTDPTLVFQEDFTPHVARFVLKVEKEETSYVLKVFPTFEMWEKEHLDNEVRALRCGADLEGITHLVYDYGDTNPLYRAILKEYAEGRSLDKVGSHLENPKLKSKLVETITEFHARGIAGLEIVARNIVVSPDYSQCRLIDLGSSRFQEEIHRESFERWKKRDWEDYNYLIERRYNSF